MTRRLFALALVLMASCGVRDTASVGHQQSALNIPGLTPVPCADPGTGHEITWQGSKVDLLVADALAGCLIAEDGSLSQTLVWDSYLLYVAARMAEANGFGFDNWIAKRADPNLNCDPVSGEANRTVQIQRTPVLEAIPGTPLVAITEAEIRLLYANTDLRIPGLNLCIAQRLRNAAPGAAAGEALLLSDFDQLWLFETMRQRAQMAMVGYAALGTVFAHELEPAEQQFFNSNPANRYMRLPLLQLWRDTDCLGTCGQGRLESMGEDFATSVQLVAELSAEVSTLMQRSRSARRPYGAQNPTRADQAWGPGSWYQRTMALLYGGDALAIRPDGPWQHPLGVEEPLFGLMFPRADIPSSPQASFLSFDWPTPQQLPYVQQLVSEPQVGTLTELAAQNGALAVVVEGACDIDRAATATRLYDEVEKALRIASCADFVSPGPCPTTATVPADTADHVLWKEHRITREHAKQAAEILADAIGRPDAPSCQDGELLARPSSQNVTGELTSVVEGSQTLLRIDSGGLMVRGLPEIAPFFQRHAPYRYPLGTELEPLGDAEVQGFASDFFAQPAEAQRLMGAVSALAATREMVASSMENIDSAPSLAGLRSTYFSKSNDIIKLINAAVGERSISVRYRLQLGSPPSMELVADAQFNVMHDVTVRYAPDDTFFSQTDPVYLNAVQADPVAANLAQHPDSVILGRSAADLVTTATAGGTRILWNGPASTTPITGAESAPPQVTFNTLPLPLYLGFPPFDQSPRWTLMLERTSMTEPTAYALALGEATLPSITSQLYSFGGTLGEQATRVATPNLNNPGREAVDGFGFPIDWVPPLNAELVGGEAGQSSAVFFLDAAKQSSTEASAAVETALNNLLGLAEDEQRLAAESALGAQSLSADRAALCGQSQTCDTTIITKKLAGLYPTQVEPPTNCTNPPPLDPGEQNQFQATFAATVNLRCFTQAILDSFANLEVPIAKAVDDQLSAPSAPGFQEYAGGALQSAFIEQWRALQAPKERIDALIAQQKTAEARVETAFEKLQGTNAFVNWVCSPAALLTGILQGVTHSTGTSYGVSNSSGVTISLSPGESFSSGTSSSSGTGYSYSPGPHAAAKQRCREEKTALAPAQAAFVESLLDATSGLSSAAVGTADAQAAIQASSANISQLLNTAALNKERNELELKLSAQGAKTSFGLYRLYRSFDLVRAKALVENARRSALTARRAIEARYVVDLSELTQPEAFVQGPASWADDAYRFDLSLPSAIGFTVTSGAGEGINANSVKDYVTNLDAFIKGYPVTRPTAVATNDIDVVTLPGLKQDQFDTGGLTENVAAPWTLLCPATATDPPTWVSHAPGIDPNDACGGPKPTRARIAFTLDPWGRLNDSIGSEPFEKRYNARWTQLAVNVVGTGVKDCTLAADPLSCYSQGFLRFDLRQTGSPWVTEFSGRWRSLGLPPGRIENGKALAAELWLDPLKEGWNTDYISAVARTELFERPMGGSYTLEIVVGPEVILNRIERIQLLAGSDAWVVQP